MTDALDATTSPLPQAPAAATETATRPTAPPHAEPTDAAAADAGTDAGDGRAETDAPRARRSRGGRGRRRAGQAAPDTADARPAEGAAQPPRRPAKAQGQAQDQARAQQPSRNKVHPVLQRLFELYPSMFGARFLPLKLGVYQDLLERHGDEFKAEDLKIALGLHARSTRYLDAVAAGHPRHDLEARPVEPVAPEHIHHAILEVFRRRQARTTDDLGTALRDRIIAAIEASGVGRDAYAERVRARDARSNVALDAALAELGRQGAKREALLRAFEATGKTEAEFADMYGMEPREVARTLQRARKDRADALAFAAAAAERAATADADADADFDADIESADPAEPEASEEAGVPSAPEAEAGAPRPA